MGVSLDKPNITVQRYCFGDDRKEILPISNHLTHGIHPYTAKLIPKIPRYFIEKYTQNRRAILDPFCGSGTTLLEGRILGRKAIGIDINLLAKLISEVKTTPINIDDLAYVIQLVKDELKNDHRKMNVDFPNKDYWFCMNAQSELSNIKYVIENLNGKIDQDIYKFLLLCFSSIIRKSSNADPRIAKTYRSKRVIEKIKEGWIPTPIQYFEEALDKNFERMKSFLEHMGSKNNHVKVIQGDAKEMSSILKNNGIDEVDFIITSPPYINAQDYFRSYKLELYWLGLATHEEVKRLNRCAIGTENLSGINYNGLPQSEIPSLNKILRNVYGMNKSKSYIVYNYFENMRDVFKECYNVLKRDGHFCLITGNNTICGVHVPTYNILTHIAENMGFSLVEIGRDTIKNRSLPPKRNHNGGFIKEEWITVFQKRGSINES